MEQSQRATINAVRGEVEVLQEEINALQTHVLGERKRWWADASKLIALGALIVSVASAWFQFYSETAKSTRGKRDELRSLIARMEDLQKEFIVASAQFEMLDPRLQSFGYSSAQETGTLAARAAGLVRELPTDTLDSGTYLAIAGAMMRSPNRAIYLQAHDMLLRAEESSEFATDKSAALQQLAQWKTGIGDIEGARRMIDRCLALVRSFEEAEGSFADRAVSTSLLVNWAQTERMIGNLGESTEFMERAKLNASESKNEFLRTQLLAYIDSVVSSQQWIAPGSVGPAQTGGA